MLAGGWGDVADAGGQLAFSLMWGVPGAVAGAAAVTWAVTASTGTMQAHLPLFCLDSRRSGLTAAFQDKSILNIPLSSSRPQDIFMSLLLSYYDTQAHWFLVERLKSFTDVVHTTAVHLLTKHVDTTVQLLTNPSMKNTNTSTRTWDRFPLYFNRVVTLLLFIIWPKHKSSQQLGECKTFWLIYSTFTPTSLWGLKNICNNQTNHILLGCNTSMTHTHTHTKNAATQHTFYSTVIERSTRTDCKCTRRNRTVHYTTLHLILVSDRSDLLTDRKKHRHTRKGGGDRHRCRVIMSSQFKPTHWPQANIIGTQVHPPWPETKHTSLSSSCLLYSAISFCRRRTSQGRMEEPTQLGLSH